MLTPQVLPAAPTSQLPSEPRRHARVRRRLVLTFLAVAAFGAALLVFGPYGLIPFGLLLAFSTDSDEEGPEGRSTSPGATSRWPQPWWRRSSGSGCGTSP
jgi:hypothetical protein